MKTFRSSAARQRILWLAIIVGLACIFYPKTSFAPPLRNHGWGARPLSQIQVCTPPPANMVAWWPGDGNAIDIQNGNNGMLNGGVTFLTGEVAQAFNLNGTDGYVSFGNAPAFQFTSEFTVDAWIRPDNLSASSFRTLITKWSQSLNSSWGLFIANDALYGIVENDANTSSSTSGGSIPAGANAPFSHVAMTYDAGGLKLYLNGVQVGSTDGNIGDLRVGSDNVQIGNDNDLIADQWFPGRVDEIELFNRALSQLEIQAIYDAGSAGKCKPVCVTPPANMISWWKGDGNLLDVQDGNTLSANGDGFGYADGKVSQAFSFNGTTFLSAGNPANLNITGNQVTIDGWVNPSMDMSNEAIFFGKSADGALQYFLEWTSGVLAGRVNNGDTEATFTPPTGVWTHLAMVYNGSSEASVTIYANGAALASTIASPASGNIISTAAPFTIGGRIDGRNFAGLIDEVEVFNRALDGNEVAGLYNAGSAGKCVPPLQLTAAASRKHHQDASVPIDAGTSDVNLPLTGGPGVECRAGPVGGEHKVVFTFTNVLMSVDSVSASATSPTGPQPVSSSGSIGADTHEYIVDLSGVPNAQYVTVTLNGAHDNFGQIDAAASATMGVLLGDTTANGAVNSSDIAQTQSQSGQPVTVDNFREDVTVNGLIDSSDIALVQSMSGTALPTPP